MTGKIAFDAQQPNGHTHIWVVDDQGVGPAKKLTEGGLSTQNKNPAWSSDGKRIAFVAHTGLGESQICVMDADGTNQQQLTSGPGIRDHPAWSPPLVKTISPWVLGSGNNAMAVVVAANVWLSALWGRLHGFHAHQVPGHHQDRLHEPESWPLHHLGHERRRHEPARPVRGSARLRRRFRKPTGVVTKWPEDRVHSHVRGHPLSRRSHELRTVRV